MFIKLWNKLRTTYDQIFVNLPNRYQGLILFVMLLVIFLK